MPAARISSMNLPRPRSRRPSSLRCSGWPTQRWPLLGVRAASCVCCLRAARAGWRFFGDFFLVAKFLLLLGQCLLQTINQLLHILSRQRLQQATGHRSQPAATLRIAAPAPLGSAAGFFQVESRNDVHVAPGHAAAALVLRALGTLGFYQ